MRFKPSILLIALATPAASDDAVVAALLDRAMAEQRVYQTCTALIPDGSFDAEAWWQEKVTETLAAIEAAGATPANLAAFTASAAPGALKPAPDTPWSEVLAFCSADPDWYSNWQRFNIVILPGAVEAALEP